MAKIQTFLPLFSGFYNTIWSGDEDSFMHENNCTYDDLNVNYEEYQNDIAKELCEVIAKKIDFVKSIKFEKVCSPKYYNFVNDSINVTIDLDKIAFKKYIKENKDSLESYLKKHYTSCSGFVSSHHNSFKGWQEDTNDFKNLDGHILGALLDFYLENEEFKEIDLYYDINTYYESYIELKETENI